MAIKFKPRTRGSNRPGSKGTRGYDRSRAKSWKYKKKGKKDSEEEPTTAVADKPSPEKAPEKAPETAKLPVSKGESSATKPDATSIKKDAEKVTALRAIPSEGESITLDPVKIPTIDPVEIGKSPAKIPTTGPAQEKAPSIPTSSTVTTASPIETKTTEASGDEGATESGGTISLDELSSEDLAQLMEEITNTDAFIEEEEFEVKPEIYFPDNIPADVTIADSHPQSDTDAMKARIAAVEAARQQAAEDDEALGIVTRESEPTEEDLAAWERLRKTGSLDAPSGSGEGSGGGSEGSRPYIEGLTDDGDPYYIDENGEPQLAPQYLIDSLGYFDDLNEIEKQILAEIKAGRRKGPRTN